MDETLSKHSFTLESSLINLNSLNCQDLPFLETTSLFKNYISSVKAKLKKNCQINLPSKVFNKQTAKKSFKSCYHLLKTKKSFQNIDHHLINSSSKNNELNFNCDLKQKKENVITVLDYQKDGNLNKNVSNLNFQNKLSTMTKREKSKNETEKIETFQNNSFKQIMNNQLITESSVSEVIQNMIDIVVSYDVSE